MKIYGPYLRKDGRKHMILVDKNQRTTVSYPKYLMEQYLGRKLLQNETVDHINSNFTDDRIENLRVLDRKKHIRLDVKRIVYQKIKIVCVWCKRTAYKDRRIIKGNKNKGKAGPFCSKQCLGEYGAELQNKRIEKFPKNKQKIIKQKYYTLKNGLA